MAGGIAHRPRRRTLCSGTDRHHDICRNRLPLWDSIIILIRIATFTITEIAITAGIIFQAVHLNRHISGMARALECCPLRRAGYRSIVLLAVIADAVGTISINFFHEGICAGFRTHTRLD